MGNNKFCLNKLNCSHDKEVTFTDCTSFKVTPKNLCQFSHELVANRGNGKVLIGMGVIENKSPKIIRKFTLLWKKC